MLREKKPGVRSNAHNNHNNSDRKYARYSVLEELHAYRKLYENDAPTCKDDMALKNGVKRVNLIIDMSDAVNFHCIYSPHASHTMNNHIRKQQPTIKLINTCLSTAAQYLNRTKSFHVSPSTTIINNKHSIPMTKSSHQHNLLVNNVDLARSVPSNINNVNPRSTIHSLPITPIAYHENRVQPVPSEIGSNENNKAQGIVYTLRRSIKRNKDRFYNKRSATMKSCNSLINYQQSTSSQPSASMTPALFFRRKYSENNVGSCTTINNYSSTMLTNDDESEQHDQMPPLQPLSFNGRNRMLPKSPLSTPSPIVHHPQQAIVPPSTVSLQSSSPITINTTDSNPIDDVQQPVTDHDSGEQERLKNELIQLKTELQKSKETIVRLQKSEEQMRERLAEQAQRQLERGGKFEDLNQVSRPTELIRGYSSLYSQARIDALDALDNIAEMSDADDLKSKLLFSVVVLAFRYAQNQARDIRNKIKQILQLSDDKSSIVLEETIEKYLRTTIQKYDVGKINFEVENQLWTTLYDYPRLKSCQELLKYINSACRTAWGLANQTPPYYIEFQTTKYDKQIHERFHTSDNESETIIEYIWPCLIDGRDRACVAKGVVITDERYLLVSKPQSS
ncbi:unnamed protein product [Rotaria socialis]